jgi:hypothetical protein
MMRKVVVLVPIYKSELNLLEKYSLDYSLAALQGRRVIFIGPKSLDRSYYSMHYKGIRFLSFDPPCFESVEEYNRL